MPTYLALFFVSALLAFAAAYPAKWLALRLGVVDHPDRRKMHQIPIPLMGGIAVFFAFMIVSLVGLSRMPGVAEDQLRAYLALMSGGIVILLLGIFDDVKGLKAPAKFAGQALAALVVISLAGSIDLFTNPLGGSVHLGWMGVPLAVLWIVGVTNAVNLIDGLDGLAVGVGGIAALGLFAVTAAGNEFLATVTIVLAGSCFGFLRHNFYPARIFLGDSGSMFIGFSLAVVGLLGSYKASTATVLVLPIMVLGVPLLDTLFAIFRRAKSRTNPFKADREHIHHRLVRIGLHHKNVVLVLYFVCAYLALTAYSIAQFPAQTGFTFFVLLAMGGIIGLRTLRFIEERLEVGLSRTGWRQEGGASGAGGGSGGWRPRKGNGSPRRQASNSTLLCEVGGFRLEFGNPEQIATLAADIGSLLSRRVRVLAVVAEPTTPGSLLILVRMAKVDEKLLDLVKDGLAWFLEEQKERLPVTEEFPSLLWIESGGAARDQNGTEGPVPLEPRRSGAAR